MDKLKCFITEQDQRSFPEQILGNTIHRSYRYAKDFSGFSGRDLSKKEPFVPGGCLEVWKVYDEFQSKQQAEEATLKAEEAQKAADQPKKEAAPANY